MPTSDRVDRSRPSISVVIGAYRRTDFLAAAVGSVPTATPSGDRVELVVATNIESAALRHGIERRGGTWLALPDAPLGRWIVEATRVTTGDVVAFLDDDDRFLPGKIERLVDRFGSDPALGYYRNGTRPAGTDSPVAAGRLPGNPSVEWRADDRPPEEIASAWRSGIAFNHSTIAVRREVLLPGPPGLEVVQGYSPHLFAWALRGKWSLRADPTALTEYAVHPGGDSGGGATSRAEQWRRWRTIAPRTVHDAEVLLALLEGDARLIPFAGSVRNRRARLLPLLRRDDPRSMVRSRFDAAAELVRAIGTPDGSTGFLALSLAHAVHPVFSHAALDILEGGRCAPEAHPR